MKVSCTAGVRKLNQGYCTDYISGKSPPETSRNDVQLPGRGDQEAGFFANTIFEVSVVETHSKLFLKPTLCIFQDSKNTGTNAPKSPIKLYRSNHVLSIDSCLHVSWPLPISPLFRICLRTKGVLSTDWKRCDTKPLCTPPCAHSKRAFCAMPPCYSKHSATAAASAKRTAACCSLVCCSEPGTPYLTTVPVTQYYGKLRHEAGMLHCVSARCCTDIYTALVLCKTHLA